MEDFKANIELCRNLFLEVLVDYDARISFLEKALEDEEYYNKLPVEDKAKLDKAVDILVANARITETRKMQQAHFGPLLGKIKTQDIDSIITFLKNDENGFIDYLQLLTIFFFKKEIESENHHHTDIRNLMADTSKKIIKKIKE